MPQTSSKGPRSPRRADAARRARDDVVGSTRPGVAGAEAQRRLAEKSVGPQDTGVDPVIARRR
jgi:hypothetical protein